MEVLEPRRLLSAPGPNWKLVWSDEFNGSHLDTSKWSVGFPWTGPDGTNRDLGSDYLSYITDNNVTVSGGALHLTTQNQQVTDPSGTVFNYTSGMITTADKFSMLYGYVEIRAQLPTGDGPGLWPAFWMLANGWPPEDDVAEFTTSDNRFHQGLAYESASGPQWDDTNSNAPLPQGFHTYGMEWGPGYQIFTMDGQITHVTRGSYVPNVPMYLLLDSGIQAQAPPTDATVFPNSFDVDYVRVYKRNAAPYVENGDFEGGSLGLWKPINDASVVTNHANSGSDALQLYGYSATAQQVITGLKPRTTYVLTAYAETDGTSQATLGVSGFGGSDVTAGTDSASYVPLTVTFTTGRGQTSATIYGLQSSGAGDVWFDDFALVQAAVVQNAGFELGTIASWNATGDVSAVAGHAHSGQFAMQQDGIADAQQTLYGLLPNTTYRVTAFARVSGSGALATVGVIDPAGNAIIGDATSNRYRAIRITFTTSANQTTATLFCQNTVDGTIAWFDDFELI